MDRIPAVRRSTDAEGPGPVFDLPHVWQNDVVHGGVRFISWVVVVNMTPKPARLRVWMAGMGGEVVEIPAWGTWGKASPGYQTASFVVDEVAEDRVDDLHMFWELTAVKA